jgi:hypothetical protein
MLDKLNLLLKTEIEEQGRDQILLSLTEKLIFIMDQLFHEASTTLSQDKYNDFSVSRKDISSSFFQFLNSLI